MKCFSNEATHGRHFNRGARREDIESEIILDVFAQRFTHGGTGLLASLPPEQSLSTIDYDRPPIHRPKHGLLANCVTDSWPYLSHVSALGVLACPTLLFTLASS